jgi:hypothetical protein
VFQGLACAPGQPSALAQSEWRQLAFVGNRNMHSILLGYVGPETVLPVASMFAAILGMLLMFGKFIWRSIVNLFRKFIWRPIVNLVRCFRKRQ